MPKQQCETTEGENFSTSFCECGMLAVVLLDVFNVDGLATSFAFLLHDESTL